MTESRRTITGLRETRGGRVAVDLDGARWRTFSSDVVVRARLVEGEELDRRRLRDLARELRRARAVDSAMRTLARRDLSRAALRQRLARRRIADGAAAEAVETLERTGYVDDERYAARRAQSLAARGHGDAAIRWRLGRDGVAPAVVDAAIAALEPESVRAARFVSARGASVRAARELARRGFGDDAVEAALAAVADGG